MNCCLTLPPSPPRLPFPFPSRRKLLKRLHDHGVKPRRTPKTGIHEVTGVEDDERDLAWRNTTLVGNIDGGDSGQEWWHVRRPSIPRQLVVIRSRLSGEQSRLADVVSIHMRECCRPLSPSQCVVVSGPQSRADVQGGVLSSTAASLCLRPPRLHPHLCHR